MNSKRIAELVKDIDPQVGILDKEGECLYALTRKLRPGGCIVEIGSWKGRSTIWLGMGAKESGNIVYAVDPHRDTDTHEKEQSGDTFEEFRYNIHRVGLEKIIVPLRMASKEAKEWLRDIDVGKIHNRKIQMVFIDGSHRYIDVLGDYLRWNSFITDGGIVAFHDTIGYQGPKKVVEDKVFKSNTWQVVGVVGQIVAAKRQNGWNLNWWVYWKVYSWVFILGTRMPKFIKEWLKKV